MQVVKAISNDHHVSGKWNNFYPEHVTAEYLSRHASKQRGPFVLVFVYGCRCFSDILLEMSQEVERVADEDAESKDEISAGVSSATPKPPPESPDGVRVRSLVIFSFWAIVIFLGLPVWWWTTSIYRARLPLHEMMDWADGKVSYAHRVSSYNADCRCPGMPTHLSTTDHR